MKIAALGFYGYGNAGDEKMLQCIKRLLPEHTVVAIPTGFSATEETVDRLNQYDFVLIGGGGLFNGAPPAPFDDFHEWHNSLNAPFGVIGVGVDSIATKFDAAMEAIVGEAEFFIVRDGRSKRELANAKVQVAPDLTYLDPLEPVIHEKCEDVIYGVNLRPVEDNLTQWMETIVRLPGTKRAIPFSRHVAFDDRLPLLKIDQSCPRSFSEDLFSPLNVMIGMAFHSVVLATQAALPTLAINYSSKVKSHMQEAGLSRYVLEIHEWEHLHDLCHELLRKRRIIQEQLLTFRRRNRQRAAQVYQDCADQIEGFGRARSIRGSDGAKRSSVLVIVDGQEKPLSHTRRSIQSCLEQSHKQLAVKVLLSERDLPQDLHEHQDARIEFLQSADVSANCALIAANDHTHDFVIVIGAGGEFVIDGLETMARALANQEGVGAVSARTFATWRGQIEERLPEESVDWKAPLNPGESCIMIRDTVLRSNYLSTINEVEYDLEPIERLKVLHIPDGLYRWPTIKCEHLMRESAFAYWHGDLATARSKLGIIDLEIADQNDVGEQFSSVCIACGYRRQSRRDPIEYWRSVINYLSDDRQRSRSFKRTAVAGLLQEQAYLLAARGQVRDAGAALLSVILNDPKKVGKRGIWKSLILSATRKLRPN